MRIEGKDWSPWYRNKVQRRPSGKSLYQVQQVVRRALEPQSVTVRPKPETNQQLISAEEKAAGKRPSLFTQEELVVNDEIDLYIDDNDDYDNCILVSSIR